MSPADGADPQPPFPSQDQAVPWPTDEWPTGAVAGRARADLERLLDDAFAQPPELASTLAVIVVQGGLLVAERYAPGFHDGRVMRSWSMAKSVLHTMVGIAVGDGRITITDPAPVPEWRDDERGTITWDDLLGMRDGLDFVEDYEPGSGSDVLRMLLGRGKADTAGYAAARPLAHPPGTHYNYSSGTSNIVARTLGMELGLNGGAMVDHLRHRLLAPLGMRSATPRLDDSGTWIGSTYLDCTARDFARFGLFALRGGTWDGTRIVDESWLDHGRAPRSQDEGRRHGSHWWVPDDPRGAFYAGGYEGQRTLIVPDADVVVVRLGQTPVIRRPAIDRFMSGVVACCA